MLWLKRTKAETEEMCAAEAEAAEMRYADIAARQANEPPDDWNCPECGYSYPADCVACNPEAINK